ncbi:uncharacterized protein BXZ73DRAFT_102311 [Epithele typhae]|uniref:uncharacterized protein n=1 Tax=Epithele typhae TaxID=378194 RepID=UPI002007C548|nr:uncharacterized protein BXZ73DRAFT_102311 [Epithele typhae]KAH9928468.1 hypothetical protein BXZ73DRAFT_102311 [Epithele typhae]
MLWTIVDVKHHKLKEEFIRRSQNTFLSCEIQLDTPNASLAEYAARIRDLSIRDMPRTSNLSPLFDVPNLETLSIYGIPERIWHQVKPNQRISLFQAHPPKLRSLTLRDTIFLPTIPPASLTHLALNHLHFGFADELLNIISAHSFTLQKIILFHILVDSKDWPSCDVMRQIKLPHLQRLTLGYTKYQAYYLYPWRLLEHLLPPPSFTLNLTGAPDPRATLEFHKFSYRGDHQVTDMMPRLRALLPWTQITAVACRASCESEVLLPFLDLLRETTPGRVRSLRVRLDRDEVRESTRYDECPDRLKRLDLQLAKALGGLVMGNPESGQVALGLAELEVSTEDVQDLVGMEPVGGAAAGLERIVFRCPPPSPGAELEWWTRMRKAVPQVEMHALEGRGLDGLRLPEVDRAKDGFVWW